MDAFVGFAEKAGGGLTNLPPDRDGLHDRLERAERSFAAADPDAAAKFVFVIEEGAARDVIGTSAIFTNIGEEIGFFSLRKNRIVRYSPDLGHRTVSDLLTLTNDFSGETEVGGLFLDPARRAGGAGKLIAQIRYLFMAEFRSLFGEFVLAELRGCVDADGNSPFWDAVGAHFFGMSFVEADKKNGLLGSRFIADLAPSYPIYANMLPEAARAVIGKPHEEGVAAYNMLMREGFRDLGYVDVFDAGPTVVGEIDRLNTVSRSRRATIAAIAEDAAVTDDGSEGARRGIACAGERPADFRAAYCQIAPRGDDEIAVNRSAAELLEVDTGDGLRYIIA